MSAFEVAGFEEIARYADGSFDIVCADTIVIYVSPDRILSMLLEIHRVSPEGAGSQRMATALRN